MGDAGGVASPAEPRRQQIVAELGRIGLVLPGSISQRHTRCQRSGCHCRADPAQLHGPYPTWTRKVKGRSITRTLTVTQAEHLRPYIQAHRRLRQLVSELERVSLELLDKAEAGHNRR